MQPNTTMTPTELRADIPAFKEGVYLNFGAHGPSPEYVVDAADEFVRTHEYESPVGDDPYETAFQAFDRTRERVATFVGAEPDEIALTESTTAGINAIANAIDWQSGDLVVRTDLEHPAGILRGSASNERASRFASSRRRTAESIRIGSPRPSPTPDSPVSARLRGPMGRSFR